jgi:acid phosphatase
MENAAKPRRSSAQNHKKGHYFMLRFKLNLCRSLLASLILPMFAMIFAFAGASTSIAQTETDANVAVPAALPLPAHVVVVIEENHGYSQVIGSPQAPYINTLASDGALFTNAHAITHPSEPNYLALFSGSTQGITDDSCPHTFSAANLGSELIAAKKTFMGYSEGLPSIGSQVCTYGKYARKHAPWTDFSNVPSGDNKPFSTFPTTFANLPTISWVVPNLLDDMHDGTIQQADSWLQTHLQAYVTWAKTNNSLLIIHYNVLRTLEALYGLPYAGKSASVTTITDVWQ